MKKSIFGFIFSLLLTTAVFAEVVPVATTLKPRQPEWRPEVLEKFEDGAAKIAIFYSEEMEGESIPVKRLHFYPNGRVAEEIDLTMVDENSESAETWQSLFVPHGLRVYFTEQGHVQKVACYDEGVLHGPYSEHFENGQIQRSLTFNHGMREGKALIYYEDGTVAEEGVFSKDLPVGDVNYYFPSGSKKCTVSHANGKVNGLVTKWYEDGSVNIEENYVDNNLHSFPSTPAVVVYGEDNSIREIKHFKNGKQHGSHTTYHENGQQKSKANFVDGKMEGPCLAYSSKGALCGEGVYKNGLAIGKHYRNHENGQLAYLAHFDNDGNLLKPILEYNSQGQKIAQYSTDSDNARHGQFQLWHANGQLEMDYNYEHGKFNGTQTEYFSNGQLKRSAHYKDLLKHGSFKEYAENGQLVFDMTFECGIPVGDVREYFVDGSAKIIKRYENGKLVGPDLEWFENGKPRLESNYVAGELDSTYKAYNESGKLIIDGTYKLGKVEGKFLTFYDDGTTKEVLNFVDGEKNGEFESYYPNGQLQAKGSYKNDQPHGEITGWYESGSKAFVRNYNIGQFVDSQIEYFKAKKGNNEVLSKKMSYNQEGKLDGEQKTHYPSGVVQSLLTYHDGQLHGMKALWDESGDLLEEAWYEEGKLEGRFFERDNKGKEIIAFYENNKKEGPYEVYYPFNEKYGKVKAIEATYRANQFVGDMFEYDETGEKRSHTRYVNGKKEGICQLFMPGEKLVLECQFQNDLRNGKCVQYFSSGKIHKEQQFKNDIQVGDEKIYFENGKLAATSQMKDGQLHGSMKNWNQQGTLIFEGEYLEGKRHGSFNKFYDDGSPRLVQHYQDDELHGQKISYDRSGSATEFAYDHGKRL
ncbi:MAG: hypothetical protein P0S95_02715 [Rhabdochlamydiaceae bacterium]|nr:hypothetical protein [Candidatus Amphrikana amoebophyrae]